MEFTEKQIEKASKAKSVEELTSLAKEEGITLTSDDAKKYFKMINTKEGELAEEELDNVTGGSCYSSGTYGPHGFKKYLIVTVGNSCRGFEMEKDRTGTGCRFCKHSFTAFPTLYCSKRTKNDDPYK